MARIFLAVLLLCSPAAAAGWSLFKSGPVEIYTNTSADDARRALAVFDQARWLIAHWLGRDELTPLWTVRLTMAERQRNARPTPAAAFKLVRDGYVAGLTPGGGVSVALLRDFSRLLLRDDTKAIPEAIETALADLVSTLEVNANLLTVGKPPEPSWRTRDWARLHLLCLNPAYAGRVRVWFANLEQAAPLDTAYRNAFERSAAQMEAEVDRYFAAGQFPSATISGKPLNPDRDYRARVISQERGQVALADLAGTPAAYLALVNSGFKWPEALEGAGLYEQAAVAGSTSAAAWLKAAETESEVQHAQELLLKAMDLNKRWVEPHLRLAALESDWGRKAAILKRAATVDARNTAVWVQLAEAQQEAKDFSGAALSWREAERSTTTEAGRAQIEARRRDYERRRLALEASERQRVADEKQRELRRLRDEAIANIRAAEAKANAGHSTGEPGKVVDWWEGVKPQGAVQGALERVECLGRGLRLQVRTPDKRLLRFVVSKPDQIAILGAGGAATLACGPQKPLRQVKIEYGENSEALTIEFQ